jgi:hypothetical protein
MKIIDVPRSGSLGGITSSRSRAGQHVRSRSKPVHRVTPRVTVVRSYFSRASAAWSSLDDAARLTWSAAAASQLATDALGSTFQLTGRLLYFRVNLARLRAGLGLSADLPPTWSAPRALLTSWSVSLAGNWMWTADVSGLAADRLLMSFSPGLSAGVSQTDRYIFSSSILGNTASRFYATVGLLNLVGQLQVGQRIFVKLVPVSQYGNEGVPTQMSCLVTA